MKFSMALQWMEDGKKVARSEWGGVAWIKLQWPDEHSLMSRPYFYIKTPSNDLIPWHPHGFELLAEDWEIVE